MTRPFFENEAFRDEVLEQDQARPARPVRGTDRRDRVPRLRCVRADDRLRAVLDGGWTAEWRRFAMERSSILGPFAFAFAFAFAAVALLATPAGHRPTIRKGSGSFGYRPAAASMSRRVCSQISSRSCGDRLQRSYGRDRTERRMGPDVSRRWCHRAPRYGTALTINSVPEALARSAARRGLRPARPIPARSASPPRATARPRISPPPCSRTGPGSSSTTYRIGERRLRSTISPASVILRCLIIGIRCDCRRRHHRR